VKPHQIIKRPLLTEKSNRLKETGGTPGVDEDSLASKVLFEVHDDANKIQIRQAIEELFKVKVADVCTQIVRGKVKRMGRFVGQRSNWKKAIVTLQAGNKIEFFEGV
jgi:large subunit ribosomal protein L23